MLQLSSIITRTIPCFFAIFFVFETANAQSSSKTNSPVSFGNATYKGINAGKVMRAWLIGGPLKISADSLAPDATSQQKYFDREENQFISATSGNTLPQISYKNKPIRWTRYQSKKDIIDFDSIYKKADFSSAYALAEIIADTPTTALFAIGSDDALKVWHNGKLVHKNWVARAIRPDDDIVKLNLVKGKNHLLLEVQDVELGWGFTARFLDKESISQRLPKAAASGDLDQLTQLLEAGADVNKRNTAGQTALDAARIHGRDEVVQVLTKNGAATTPVYAADKLIDGLYNPLKDKKLPGITVLVSKDGSVVYNKAFGYANLEKNIESTPETKYRIGSITKQFVAAAILKLQEDGKLKVTDKLSKWFPDFPRANEVTVHHLLTHTSGIPSFTNKPNFLEDVIKPTNDEQVMNYFKNDKYDFNPGEKFQYNNSGYFLLGYIIEKITNQKFPEYLKKTFFDSLGMNNTGAHSPGIKLEKEAMGYSNSDSGYHRSLDWNMDWAGGAGSLYSTTGDLHKWAEALFNGRIVNKESLKAAFTPVVLNNGTTPPGSEYGYGWGISKHRDIGTIGHSGGLHGFVSQLMRVPDENLTVILLTNSYPPEMEMNPNVIAEFFLWNKMAKQSSYAKQEVSEEQLEKFAGRYDFSNGMVMMISKEGNDLFAQLSGQPKFPIFPSGPTTFFWKVVDAKINFIANPEGQVTKAHFEQGGYKVDAPRMKDLEFIKVDSASLGQYTGHYKLKENTTVIVTSANGKLYGQATGDARYELMPVAADEFMITELNAKIRFTKDTTGKVNNLNLDMPGQKVDAPRIK